jgi:hypothetical protein
MDARPRMAKTETLRSLLALGNRLSVGRACEVATLVRQQPRKISQLIECLWDEDAGIANRAADALEKATYTHPEILQPWKEALLGLMAEATENKLRWNLALIAPRLELTIPETERAAAYLRAWLDDRSSIVKTCSMQGLAGLTQHNAALLPEVLDLLRILTRSGTPAMRARGRILLRDLEPAASRQPRIRKWPIAGRDKFALRP